MQFNADGIPESFAIKPLNQMIYNVNLFKIDLQAAFGIKVRIYSKSKDDNFELLSYN